MKIKITFILSLLFFSCGRFADASIFETPQPPQETELKEIPKKLIGTYESLIDSSFLIISNNEVLLKTIYNLNVAIADLNSSERNDLKDTIYLERKSSMTRKVTVDSIFQRTLILDTLHYSSEKYVIKKSKGYYFLNQRFRGTWFVRTLRITDKGILIGTIKSNKTISALDDYSLIEPDSITYKAPSQDELRRFLTDERFKDEWKFIRIEYGLQQKF